MALIKLNREMFKWSIKKLICVCQILPKNLLKCPLKYCVRDFSSLRGCDV